MSAKPRVVSVAVLAVGGLLTILCSGLVRRADVSAIGAQFDAAAENRVSAFNRELESYYVLPSVLRSFGNGGLDEKTFLRFAREKTAGGSPDRWLWLLPVADPAKPSQIGASIPSQFAGDITTNRHTLNQLMSSAAEARRQGKPVASPGVQIGDRYFSFLCTPTDAGESPIAVTAIDMGAALERGMSYLRPHGIDVTIREGRDHELYAHRSRRHQHAADQPCSGSAVAFEQAGEIRFGGRVWTVYCKSVPEFVSASLNWHSWMLLIGGLVITILAAGVIYLILTRAERIRKLVDKRTAELVRSNERLQDEIRVRTHTQIELAAEEHRYQELFESASDIVLTTDADGVVTSLNPAAETALGWTSNEARTARLAVLPAETVDAVRRHWASNVDEYEVRTADGRSLTLEFTVSRLMRDGQSVGVLAMGRDVTSRRRLEQFELGRQRILEMVAQEAALESIFAELCNLVRAQLPGSTSCVLLRRGTKLVVASGSDLPGLAPLAIEPAALCSGRAAYWAKAVAIDVQGEAGKDDPELNQARAAGYAACWSTPLLAGTGKINGTLTVYLESAGSPNQYEHSLMDKAAHLAGLALERRQWADSLMHQAQHDYLTGLPNRLLFRDRLQHAIARGRRSGTVTALLYIDLDGFKLVNDTLGHPVGDRLLQSVSQRLEARVRATDTLARMGGDEFTLIATDLTAPADAEELARDVLTIIRNPFSVDGHELYVSASIGISAAPRDGEDEDTLQRHADAALYCAKRNGKNTYRVFTPASDAGIVDRLGLHTDLHHALARQQFRLVYQPQVNLMTGELLGFEALLRWEHPSLGVISPAKFIPIAEETGMILGIGAWVFREACRQLREWQDEGLQLRMAVNVSALEFAQQEWEIMVRDTIEEFGVQPSLLDLEVTETLVLNNIDDAAERMQRLRAIGVNISIDDFGTGYSSLSYLQNLPVGKLKIDLSFVREIQDGHPRPAIVKAIIDLALGLGMTVTAEGIETKYQMDVLRSMHCAEAQGYYFGKPLDAGHARAMLISGVAPRDEVESAIPVA